MNTGIKVVISLVISVLVVLGFFSFPYLDTLIEECTGTFLCGAQVKNTLDYFGQTDSAAIALGGYFYQKLITGVITFLIILGFSIFAHKIYTKFVNRPE